MATLERASAPTGNAGKEGCWKGGLRERERVMEMRLSGRRIARKRIAGRRIAGTRSAGRGLQGRIVIGKERCCGKECWKRD